MVVILVINTILLVSVIAFTGVMDYKEKDALEKKWEHHPLRAYFSAKDLEKASQGKWDDD